MTRTALFVVASLIGGALSASQAICGMHGRWLNTQDGHTPCDIAAILIGGGSTFFSSKLTSYF
jgi:hypothetical protein